MNSGVVWYLRAKRARKFKTTPTFTLTSPTLYALYSSANAHTSHKSRVTASVLAQLVAQAIRWRYSQAWIRRCVVAFEMVWGGCNPSNPPPRSAHAYQCMENVGGKHAHIDTFVAHCACRVQCWDKVKDLDGSLENMLNVFSLLFVTRSLRNGTINGGK